ncbi:hypothetical protein B1757_12805 [Acidithiobacillus marinus]|uniref:Uncharacterized protein n=1 Tax=Acidithiobacillus marinus TaxID=187490 RepID=A0A2I1DIX1_9PROT|nr:hypothetical protein [Acidithiobacillus marinus]PKY09823.1 hypothetical protein B1757_12805 [Acidithiobacillus marinus]
MGSKLGLPRRSGLGHYNATKPIWKTAYRKAREWVKFSIEPDYKAESIAWKAMLIVMCQRKDTCDPLLSTSIHDRLATQKIIYEILSKKDRSTPSCSQGENP